MPLRKNMRRHTVLFVPQYKQSIHGSSWRFLLALTDHTCHPLIFPLVLWGQFSFVLCGAVTEARRGGIT
jgi:hypothetical protein